MRRLRLPEHDLALPHWPQRLDGLRVAVVSDLHTGGPRFRRRHLEALVETVNAAAVDVVALLGDYVDPDVIGGGRIDPAAVAQRLARLRSPAVAVLGNHDWHHEGHGAGAALRHAGIPVLENDALTLDLRGGPLHVAGLADTRHRDPRVGSALAGIPEGEPIVLLAHDPDVFPYVPARVSLTLAGHLHGGQIDLPGVRRFVMPTRHGSRFKEGHVVEAGRHLFVSRGVGYTGLPIRVGAPPEVPILRLQSEESLVNAGTT
jgi:predicted MPP superfamily phosphohydrolase